MPSPSSRRYVKRIWRLPKHRGPLEYLATLICKTLRKHGWPAEWKVAPHTHTIRPEDRTSCFITTEGGGDYLAPDFLDAVSICCRIVALTYGIDLTEDTAFITLNRRYVVTDNGKFREVIE